MSYILEALKRAERERHVGRTPSIEPLAQSPLAQPPRRRPQRSHVLAVASLAIFAAAVVLLLRKPPPPPPSPPPAATTAAVPPPRALAAAAPPAIGDADAITSLDDLSPTPEPDVPERVMPARAPAPLQPQDLAAPPVAAGPAGELAAVPPPAATAAEPQGGILPLREMPEAYRAQFPVHSLDVHVYDPEPARRWIMVGGRRYREGETLDGGAQIAQIVDSGVIFDFAGSRVLFPVR